MAVNILPHDVTDANAKQVLQTVLREIRSGNVPYPYPMSLAGMFDYHKHLATLGTIALEKLS